MKMVVDANIIVSAILGRRNRFGDLLRRDIILMVPEPQLVEAAQVLARITEVDAREAQAAVADAVDDFVVIVMPELQTSEEEARRRLDTRGQPNWPVLAAAMTFDAHIWSNDRDFFGVGMPVWSMRNIAYASPQGTLNA